MMQTRDFISKTLMAHEDGLSLDKVDSGNWYRNQLVGSKYGVTGAALATHRKVTTISANQMAALTKAEAVDIAVSLYYDKPNLDMLLWNAVTASILDMGYNAGPTMANKLLQRLLAVGDDGKIGPYTAAAYGQWIKSQGEEECARDWSIVRKRHYENVIAARPSNAKYRNGWFTRAESFLPGTAFWKAFHT